MKLGIAIEETWDFFHEIYKDLSSRHETSLFKRRTTKLRVAHSRINNYYFRNDLRALMQQNDVVFFEWASHLLEAASHMPKSCGIVTRLHRYEMYQFAERIQCVDRVILVAQNRPPPLSAHAHKTVVSAHRLRWKVNMPTSRSMATWAFSPSDPANLYD